MAILPPDLPTLRGHLNTIPQVTQHLHYQCIFRPNSDLIFPEFHLCQLTGNHLEKKSMATLRRTFNYPSSESSSDNERDIDDELDDQQQTAIISDLRARDARSAAQYRVALTVIPLLAAVAHVPLLFRGSYRALLAVSSLLVTGWTVWGLPRDGPAGKWLPVLNGVLAVVLAIGGVGMWQKDAGEGAWAVMPGVIYGLVMVARRELVPLDVEGLERLRYEYRGA